jgi:hypothetical protein
MIVVANSGFGSEVTVKWLLILEAAKRQLWVVGSTGERNTLIFFQKDGV